MASLTGELLVDPQLAGFGIHDDNTHLEPEALCRELFGGATNDLRLAHRGLDDGMKAPGGSLSNRPFDPQAHVGAGLVGGRAPVGCHQRGALRMKRPQLVAIDVRNATAVAHQVSHRLHRRCRLASPGLAAHHDQLRRCAG